MTYIRFVLAAILPILLGGTLYAQSPAPEPKYELSIAADRTDARYKIGEKVVFNAELKVNGRPAKEMKLPYIVQENSFVELAQGEMVFKDGKASLNMEFRKPSFLLVVVTIPETKKVVYAGACCEPEKLTPSMPKPNDFDAFWDGKKAEVDALPFKVELKPIAEKTNDKIETYELILNNINGTKIYGYFAKPKGKGPFPAYMEVNWAGVYSITPDSVSKYASRGAMAIDINPHEIENGKPQEYYNQLQEGSLHKYPFMGRDSRDTCYFLRMFCSCYRAAQYITSRPEWDGKKFLVYGASQGGGQAFVTAALSPKVTTFVAIVPALCDHTGREVNRQSGWPQIVEYVDGKPDPKQLEASRYFDCVNFAYRIKAKALVSAGFIDKICAPCSVYTAFNVLSGPKRIIDTPLHGHGRTLSPFAAKDAALFIQEELGLSSNEPDSAP